MEKFNSLTSDRFFKCKDEITQQIIYDIIVDRKFKVPKSFYPYITTNVIMMLLEDYDNKELLELLSNICKNGFHDFYYLGLRLLETNKTQYLFLLNPKFFLHIYKNFYKEQTINLVDVIRNRITYMDEIPYEYLCCIAISMGIDYKFKLTVSNYYYMIAYAIRIRNTYFNDRNLTLRVVDHIINQCILKSKDKDVDNLWRRDCLYTCWVNGYNIIPDNVTEFELLQYLTIHQKQYKAVEYPDNIQQIVNRVLDESKDQHTIDIIKSRLIDSINLNLNNIKALTWELDSNTLSCIRYLYNNSKMTLNNYRYYHDIMIYNMDASTRITFDEYSHFIVDKCGKEIDENLLTIYDYGEYVNFILTVLPDDVLCDKFIYDDKIPTYQNGANNHSILKYIIDNYIIPNQNSRLIDRVLKLILPNNDILDVIIDNRYATIFDLIQRTGKDLRDILVVYPNISKYIDDIPRLTIIQTIRRNPDAVRKMPVHLVPSNFILDEIKRNGYFELIHYDNNLDQPVPYIPTDGLLDIISVSGNGIGYCIDYQLEDYDKVVLNAIYDIYESKYSIK